MPHSSEPSDEQLMAKVALGAQDALGPLYTRYARLVFNVAAQTLERAVAEEIMQEVFLVVWRRARLFDPERGTFRSWVLQITHFRVLNELRRRSRQPQLAPDPEDVLLASIADEGAPPAERVVESERRAAVRAALAAVPDTQRQAVRLAVLESRTHEQVAGDLDVPLGTAKTRIRVGMQSLRRTLVARAAVLGLVVVALLLGIRERRVREDLARDDRALVVLTASDLENVRLSPAAGYPEATHARYRSRAGTPIGIVTLSSFPALEAGRTYQAWVRRDGTWIGVGTLMPDANGNGRLIVERPELAVPPAAVQITIEPNGGSATPTGAIVASWQRAER
jgi:RNA polymerase sigma-70 factor (ECF subfamily)